MADALRPGRARRARVDDLPGHDERAGAADPRARRAASPGGDFFLGYSPERIDPGNPSWGLVNTPKVVSGVDEASLRCVEAFYRALVDKVVVVGSTAEAELVKLLENTFRHVNIALVNELAMYAADLGIDIWSAIDAASTKPFGYMRFTPGPGVGGHCLPIDPSLPVVAGQAQPRPHVPLRRAGERRQRAHARLRRDPDHGAAQPGRAGRSAAAGSSPSGSATRRGRRTGGSRRRWRSSSGCSRSAPTSGRASRTCPPVGRPELPVPVVPCTVEEIAAADLVVVLVDHPELPLDDIAEHARLVLDTAGLPAGPHVPAASCSDGQPPASSVTDVARNRVALIAP